ncbi:phage tail protein [Labrys sp. WJW]|uniref:phage major tail tube protein n=1 Tax=Labrys sp. WJW TaxID=1737983 RepID=UPI00082BD20E|nr:phage major tail tube protein [Labrys sp. WJW]OCC05103.1 phage tail protein [Labrys sp. WJW]
MSNSLYFMEAANLYCGDTDPTKSKHLTIEDVTFSDLQAQYADHHPGGSYVGVEFEVGVNKLNFSFKLKGWDPDLLKQFGLGTRLKNTYTAYGVIRDKRTGRAIEVKVIAEARLGKATADQFTRGQGLGFSYALNEITHYEIHFDGAEIFYWDFWTNTLRTGEEDQNTDVNRILRIPNAS